MNKKFLALLPVLALLGQGCEMAKPTTAVQTPQVYFVTKTFFSAAELTQIRRDIIDPIIAHYDDETYGHAVSIMLKKAGTDLIVEIIIDQTWTEDAGYEGVVLTRMKDGSYEAWTPTDPGPGYEG